MNWRSSSKMRGTGYKEQCAPVTCLTAMLEKIEILPVWAAEGFFRVVMEIGVLKELFLVLFNTVKRNQQSHGWALHRTKGKRASKMVIWIPTSPPLRTKNSFSSCELWVRFFWPGDCLGEKQGLSKEFRASPLVSRMFCQVEVMFASFRLFSQTICCSRWLRKF